MRWPCFISDDPAFRSSSRSPASSFQAFNPAPILLPSGLIFFSAPAAARLASAISFQAFNPALILLPSGLIFFSATAAARFASAFSAAIGAQTFQTLREPRMPMLCATFIIVCFVAAAVSAWARQALTHFFGPCITIDLAAPRSRLRSSTSSNHEFHAARILLRQGDARGSWTRLETWG